MKKIIGWFLKAILAGVIAFCIASVFCLFYYNLPIHHTNESGATDYFWDKSAWSLRGTEGFACTKTDENGFVNTFPIKSNTIDVLIMGSSHAEAFNVNSDENMTYLLNEKFHSNGDNRYAYCIGTSAHAFVRCLNNLTNALTTYQPTGYVVIETAALEFDMKGLEQLNTITAHSSITN